MSETDQVEERWNYTFIARWHAEQEKSRQLAMGNRASIRRVGNHWIVDVAKLVDADKENP